MLLQGFDLYVPLKRSKMNEHPPWYSKRLTRLKNKMSRANKNYKNGLISKLAFCAVRKEFQTLQSESYNSYLAQVQSNFIRDPSQFWTYVNSKKKTDGYPSHMKYGEVKASDRKNVVELFANFF